MCNSLIVVAQLVVLETNECLPLAGETPCCDLVWRLSQRWKGARCFTFLLIFVNGYEHSCVEYVIAEPTDCGRKQGVVEIAIPFTCIGEIDRDVGSCVYSECRYKSKDIPFIAEIWTARPNQLNTIISLNNTDDNHAKMKFTTVVSLLAGSAIAAPTDMRAADTSADASSIANVRLADMFSERQMAVLKVLSEHQQDLGLSEQEKALMDAFMAALHDEAEANAKRDLPVPVPALPVSVPAVPVPAVPVPAVPVPSVSVPGVSVPAASVGAAVPTALTPPLPASVNATAPTTGPVNPTALGNLGSAIDALNTVNNATGLATGAVGSAASGVANATAGATGAVPDLSSILKGIPALGPLLANVTSTAGGAAGAAPDLSSILKGIPALGALLANATSTAGGATGAVPDLSSILKGIPALGPLLANVTSTAGGAAGAAPDLLSILKGLPALGALLANATSTVGGATSGLGSATTGLSGLTGALGGLTGGLGGLTGGLGGLTGGLDGLTGGLGGLTGGLGGLGGLGALGGLLGGLRRGGLLGGIIIPGIL
jgi:hypothetical protein